MLAIQKRLCPLLRWVTVVCRHSALANLVEERGRSDEQGEPQIKMTEVLLPLRLHCTLQPWSNHSFRCFRCSESCCLTNTLLILRRGHNPKNRTCREPRGLERKTNFINGERFGTEEDNQVTRLSRACVMLLGSWRRHRRRAAPAVALPWRRERELAETLITSSAAISSSDTFEMTLDSSPTS